MVLWEGTRPLLVEIQALVDHSMLANPRRVAVGLEQNRLALLLAVLHRHGGVQMGDQDVFVNVVGGVKVTETGADLALLLALVPSWQTHLIHSRRRNDFCGYATYDSANRFRLPIIKNSQ